MGVPLTNFTVLKYIADGIESKDAPRDNLYMQLALDALKEYSIFAFVLHDPNAHPEFHEFFQRQFEDLHYSSGEHLVFFGLADAPEMKTLVGRKDAYRDIRDMISGFEEEEQRNVDLSYSAFALANSLDIKPEKLPAIIVTNDFRLDSFRYYKTCPKEMEKQMGRIASISRKIYLVRQLGTTSIEEEQKLLNRYLDEAELDLCNGMGDAFLTESLARALSDVMSFIVQMDDTGDSPTREAKRIAEREKRISINRVISSLNDLKRAIGEVDEDNLEGHQLYPLIEKLNIKLANFITMLEKGNVSVMKDPLPIKEAWLDNHSVQLLQTAIEVEAFLKTKKLKLDYSSSAICLAKMFEQEINNSIVHWFRKKHSIQLPEYYNEVQPRVKAFAKPNFPEGHRFYPGTPINLNSERNRDWAPPELGKSKNLAHYNLSEQDWHQFGITNYKEFLDNWDNIHKIRNKAAHTEEVTLKDLSKMKSSLTKMATTHTIERLAHLKNTFKRDVMIT
ncbi:hypothetical protein J2S74_000745 [Evansella vedderi]|uniref:Swt1-like HEPN domain-containing protein n=1 Tax=Evansella vedderi TaxID=38282 RepID=A0ABT9ZSB2_9BACI|nr:hypothetical protein [Evansella vedderi]MDQ0253373.1 hypothetical protein [Evansella vedderi]